MPGKILIFTGAPESHRLDWSDSELLTTFQPSIAQFALLQTPGFDVETTRHDSDKSLLDLAVWRSLPLQRTHIHTGFSQQHDLHFVGRFPSSADFLTTADISFKAPSQGLTQEDDGEEDSRLLAEFYEHSLAVHDDLASSQLVPPSIISQEPAGNTNVDDTTSFNADDSLASQDDEDGHDDEESTSFLPTDGTTVLLKTPLKPAQGGGVHGADLRICDLEDIPSAKVLLSLVPQTVTVNLIVCIISIAAPRIVETRYGTTSTLIEVLVGDETKSGFSITFWLSARNNHNNDDDDKIGYGVLTGLRSQDIVLMQNVALNVFRDKVYGGSLRRDMTKVHLLFRGRLVDEADVGGYYSRADLAKVGRVRVRDGQRRQEQQPNPQLEKTKRVREWVLDFVGGGSPVSGGHGGGDVGVEKRMTTAKRKRTGKERAPPPRDWEQPPPLDSPSRLG